jgi:uncharacterized protein YbaP (TraB family)
MEILSKSHKKQKKLLFIIALLGILLFSLCFSAVRAEADEALLWRIDSPNGSVLYLFGSIHMAKKTLFPLKPLVMAAFESSDRLIVELDPQNVKTFETIQVISKKGIYPIGQTLASNLPPDILALLKPHMSLLPNGSKSNLKPWLAALTLDVLVLEKLGYSAKNGVDEYFISQAKEKGLEIKELETALEQMTLFADMSDYESEIFLKSTLLDLNKVEVLMEELTTAWYTGNEPAFAVVFFDTFREWPELSPLLERTIFGRNVTMAKRLFPYLSGEKSTSFTVVGSGHLVGPRGIPAMFREAGFEVTKY